MSEELSVNEYRQQRIQNMEKLEAAGFPAFGQAFERSARLDELHADFEEGKTVKACGRIVAMRKMGKMAFAHISDGSDKFQLMVKKDVLGEENFAAFKLLDLGDIIGVEGELFITRTEEETIRIESWTLLSRDGNPATASRWIGHRAANLHEGARNAPISVGVQIVAARIDL